MKKPDEKLRSLGLAYNPFEPAASGPALAPGEIWIPDRWRADLVKLMEEAATATTPKAVVLVGEYGSGKTVLLRWLERSYFTSKRTQAYYFENPGVRFYDLANSWFRQIGRFEMAKALVELLGPDLKGYQMGLFESDFLSWLRTVLSDKRKMRTVADRLQAAIIAKEITPDEEIAHRMAMLVMETPLKPYFEYKDFVAGRTGSLVAERQEARYFKAFIRAMRTASGVESMAFLIDEFEEVSLQKTLTAREAHEYFATLKRLIDLSGEENFWLVVTMTPSAFDIFKELAPPAIERFAGRRFDIQPLAEPECEQLIEARLTRSRPADYRPPSVLFPFPDGFSSMIGKSLRSTPRRLVQWAFWTIAQWVPSESVPFDSSYLRRIEAGLTKPHGSSETASDKQ